MGCKNLVISEPVRLRLFQSYGNQNDIVTQIVKTLPWNHGVWGSLPGNCSMWALFLQNRAPFVAGYSARAPDRALGFKWGNVFVLKVMSTQTIIKLRWPSHYSIWKLIHFERYTFCPCKFFELGHWNRECFQSISLLNGKFEGLWRLRSCQVYNLNTIKAPACRWLSMGRFHCQRFHSSIV